MTLFCVAIAAAFLIGGLTAAWIRQADIDALRNDLELSKTREDRLQDQLNELRASRWAHREIG